MDSVCYSLLLKNLIYSKTKNFHSFLQRQCYSHIDIFLNQEILSVPLALAIFISLIYSIFIKNKKILCFPSKFHKQLCDSINNRHYKTFFCDYLDKDPHDQSTPLTSHFKLLNYRIYTPKTLLWQDKKYCSQRLHSYKHSPPKKMSFYSSIIQILSSKNHCNF